MLASTVAQVRNNFKDYCDRVVDDDEVLVITRPGERNVVMMSLKEFTALQNQMYLAKADRALEQIKTGKGIPKKLKELRNCERSPEN
ncbi:type II toxin-antitoxin system Phd/YefM family antitoxin [Jonquetella anthropi]|uniref:type II toxin-antitoxin system Phd/YefM family antitoxin n=1 Tax=Jonquetella anthropi TaxID=428712 RepID=UPI0001B91267|nr:type II toxin-antitoxin system Phd/YefM family antitoxin [Jonquetella anthropi]EEX47762.1 prevent-host-death family protein [Jonquetella anthropi E3_33 E1]